ncbi:MAG TPA: hypothetical protein PKE26_00090 [Kiritimatiellia bacterium]|nr:hypothetical protein [Kiritimatiellia bacterium]HMO97493.1 hypothetical protein [Kiritimatiellia bacterium]HMP96302.1 hypothetical protein [Kiritimatiellia bacterium]
MSLLGKIAALFGGSSDRKTCVVDGDRLAGGDRVGPGERFQALSKLGRFAAREELEIHVVFGGRPLREAGDGDTYNGVHVYYAETPSELRPRMEKVLGSAGRGKSVLVISDQAWETECQAKGIALLRIGTLRKAMEASASENSGREGGDRFGNRDRSDRGERGDRGDRDGGRRGNRNRNRGPRRQPQDENRAPRPAESGSGESAPNRPAAESPAKPASGADTTVKNLIDLVE